MPSTAPASAGHAAESSRPDWGWIVVRAAVLIGAGLWVFAPALHGVWLWDDGSIIRSNPLMADPHGWWKFWFAPPGPDYFPLTSTVEWGLWRIFGDDTLPFHLTSLGLHLLSALLLWRLFARLGLRLAWFGALLFTVHPVVVESVAWISELKNTVSLPLALGSMLCWLRYEKGNRPLDLSASLLFFLAALLAKTSVVMLPFILLLYRWWKHGSVTPRQRIVLAQFFAIGLVMGVITICFQQQWAIGEEKLEVGGPLVRLAGAGWATLFYFGQSVWPIGLLPAYAPWSFNDLTVAQFLPWVVLAAAFGWLWMRRESWGRPVLFGLGFFVLNLAPVLGFLPMSYMRIAWVADHFVYLPLIGLVGLVIGGAERMLPVLPKMAGRVSAAALALIFALLSHSYAGNFRSQEVLWSYTLKVYPDSWLGSLDLGLTLNDAHRLPEAVAWLARSEQLNNNFYGTHVALADVMAQLNQLELAAAQYRIAWKLHPESLELHINYGNVLFRQSDLKGAEQQYYLATLYQPLSVEAHYNLANILLREGRRDEAIAQYQAVLGIDPGYAAARDVLTSLHAASPVPKSP